jgi:hypothetical protein
MIVNFESVTKCLSDDELQTIAVLIGIVEKHSTVDPITGPELIKALEGYGHFLTGPRFRKLCNFIRSNSVLPLIATSKGYYVSYDPLEIANQIQSLEERAQVILAAASGLKKFLTKGNEMEVITKMGMQQFIAAYRPIINPQSALSGNYFKFLFPDLLKEDPNRVFTAMDEDRCWSMIHEGDDLYIVKGLVRENSLGVLITEISCTDNLTVDLL